MNLFIDTIFSISPQNLMEDKIPVPGNFWIPKNNCNTLKVIEPEYEKLISVNNQRRMCKLVKMGVYAALSCVENIKEHSLDAIIVGNGLSVFDKTTDFLQSIISKEEKGLSPTPFIQSLHSTIAGQVALELQFNGYVTTYTQNAFSFENSLSDAFLLAEEAQSDVHILLGALDDIPPSYIKIYEQLGRLKSPAGSAEFLDKGNDPGIVIGEGCVFMKLSSLENKNSLACIKGLKAIYNPENYSEVVSGIHELMKEFDLREEDIDTVFWGHCGDQRTDETICMIQSTMFKNNKNIFFKNYCGEYPTASSFALWMSVMMMNNKKKEHPTQPGKEFLHYSVIINQYNNEYYSIILLSNA